MSRYATEAGERLAGTTQYRHLPGGHLVRRRPGDRYPARSGAHPVLLLHGGGRPGIRWPAFAAGLAERYPVQVLSPVHPGFGRHTPARWARFGPQAGRAGTGTCSSRVQPDRGHRGGDSSVGGWIAAELALAAPDRVSQLVLLDAAGLASADHPVADYFAMTLDQVFDVSFAHPDRYRIDPAQLTSEQQAIAAGNRAALEVYGGRSMADPGLAARLAGIAAPTLVVWGEADRMVTPAYGRESRRPSPGYLPGAAGRRAPAADRGPRGSAGPVRRADGLEAGPARGGPRGARGSR